MFHNRVFTVHGVDYYRIGCCNRCGECEKPDCPHYSILLGTATCDCYDERETVCDFCTNDESSMWYRKGKPITHSVCVGFPNHPFLRVIKNDICGFKFIPATRDDEKRHRELIEAWQ
jgi:hypothetical protein